jgi:hypothetical protein
LSPHRLFFDQKSNMEKLSSKSLFKRFENEDV